MIKGYCIAKFLSEENIRAITGLMLTDLKTVMAERNMNLTWEDEVVDYLSRKGYSAVYGARNLQRLIQKEVEDAIATEIVDNRRGAVTQVKLTFADGGIRVLAL